MTEPGTSPDRRGSRGLIAQAANYLSAGLVSAVLAYGTVAVLTRLMTTAEYGVYTLFQAVAGLSAALFSLSFGQATTRFYLDDEAAYPSYLKTTASFLLLLNLLIVGGAWLLRAPMGTWFALEGWMLFAGVVVGVLRIPWVLLWKTMVAQRRAKRFARLSMVRDAVLMLITLAGALLYLSWGTAVAGAIFGLTVASLVVALAAAVWILHVTRGGKIQPKHLRFALRFGGPLVPATIAGAALNLIDRALIQALLGAEDTGLYSFAYNIGLVMNLGMLAALQAFNPVFVRCRDDEDYGAIGRGWMKLSIGLCGLALGLVLFSREAAWLLGGERFLVSLGVVPWVVLGYLARSYAGLFAQYAIHRRRTEWNAGGTILAAASNVGLNLWLLPLYGFQAAAWTTYVSFLILMGWNYLAARFVLKERVVHFGQWVPLLVAASLALPALQLLLVRVEDNVPLTVLIKVAGAAFAVGTAWRFVLRPKVSS